MDLVSKQKERNVLEERLNSTKDFNELKHQKAELEGQMEADREVFNDENT